MKDARRGRRPALFTISALWLCDITPCTGSLVVILFGILEALQFWALWIQPLGAGSTEGRAEDVPWVFFQDLREPFRAKVVRVLGFRLQRLQLTVLKACGLRLACKVWTQSIPSVQTDSLKAKKHLTKNMTRPSIPSQSPTYSLQSLLKILNPKPTLNLQPQKKS